jgi:formylglycine-generating enzyme required for sulfatase activity
MGKFIRIAALMVTAAFVLAGCDDGGGGTTQIAEIDLSEYGIEFVQVPAGSFQRDATEGNVSVINNAYWMSTTQITQELFEAVMGANPSVNAESTDSEKVPAAGEVQGKRPVVNVNWYAMIAFCNRLSLATGKDPIYSVAGVDWENISFAGVPATNNAAWNAVTADFSKNGYRLPTEMERIWAAMGADTGNPGQPNTTGWSKAFAGDTGENNIDDYVWYNGNSGDQSHQVGKKSPNELGLYDMGGNAYDRCWDRYVGKPTEAPEDWSPYPAGKLEDYTGPDEATEANSRLLLGGGFRSTDNQCSVTYRMGINASYGYLYFGFRVVYR